MASIRGNVISTVRRQIRDESKTVFTDTELQNYYANTIYAYSQYVPREIASTLILLPNVAEYSAPSGLLEAISIKKGSTIYDIVDYFADVITISPVPTVGGNATIKYRGLHTVPTNDNLDSSYDIKDEQLIIKNIIAQCWETLAGDGAKYYEYTEGDVRENQGKTQAQFRAEADKLLAEFEKGCIKSAEAMKIKTELVTTAPTVAGVINRTAPTRNDSILKDY